MTISRRTLITAAGGLAGGLLLTRPARAAFPDRFIRFIVPFAAGGNADTVGRLVGQGMTDLLGQPIVVENRPGAGGSIGAEMVARSAPDGYTVLIGPNGPLVNNQFIQAKVGYETLKDFMPVGLTSIVPHSLVVTPSLPVKTIAEFVALSKSSPIEVATSGYGSATHFTLERFIAKTGANVVHVPYRSGGALMPDLIGGSARAAMTEFSIPLPLHMDGKVRILAIGAEKRSSLAPEIPTMIEAGVPDFIAGSYVGLLVPAATPADVVDRLQGALAKALASKLVLDQFAKLGIDVVTPDLMAPPGFIAFIKRDQELCREAAKVSGMTPK
jgi:tripartite-type tricarboxylate transporter receptor subunit TctC